MFLLRIKNSPNSIRMSFSTKKSPQSRNSHTTNLCVYIPSKYAGKTGCTRVPWRGLNCSQTVPMTWKTRLRRTLVLSEDISVWTKTPFDSYAAVQCLPESKASWSYVMFYAKDVRTERSWALPLKIKTETQQIYVRVAQTRKRRLVCVFPASASLVPPEHEYIYLPSLFTFVFYKLFFSHQNNQNGSPIGCMISPTDRDWKRSSSWDRSAVFCAKTRLRCDRWTSRPGVVADLNVNTAIACVFLGL